MTTANEPTFEEVLGVSLRDAELRIRRGLRVRTERERRGWTQMRLAEASGQSQATISAIERGVADGSAVARYAIERALEVPGLFDPADENSTPDEVAS